MILSGWGNFPRVACRTAAPRTAGDLTACIPGKPLIARGNGRAYGDAALQPNLTVLTKHYDRFLNFDSNSGRLTCEAGTRLDTILDVFVPRGWFPPVTPGTKYVTVGGMIAADAHGKNHHVAGGFGRHVESLRLMLADGRIATCGPTENADLFAATLGGMGLTGIILDATFRLLPIGTAWMVQETVRLPDLDSAMAEFEASAHWTYTVAWIDCLAGGARLGRSVLFRGEHAEIADLPADRQARPFDRPVRRLRRVPFEFPTWVLNRWSVRAFNALYYGRAANGHREVVDLDAFFYPLDAILDWNRIYGAGGFTQYQCVLPKSASRDGLTRLLTEIARSGRGSFLAVLKLMGPQSGLLSFPLEGYTLALDFPVTPPTLNMLLELDAIVRDHGGRLYMAKDARMSPAMLRRGYPELDRFQDIRAGHGARGTFQSLLAERLDL